MAFKRAVFFLVFIILAGYLLTGCENTSSETLVARAEQAYLDKEYRAAVLDLKSALSKDGDNAKARWLLAEVYLALEDGASAVKELKRARSLGVDDNTVIPAIAHAEWLQANHDEVLALPVDVVSASASKIDLFAFRSLAQVGKGEFEEAATELEQASKIGGESRFLRFAQIRLLASQLELDAALAEAKRLTQDEPAFAAAWTLQGDLLGLVQQFDAAEEAYSQAIANRSNTVDDYVKRGFARIAQADWKGAEADAQVVTGAAPNFQLGQYLTGLVHYQQGRYDTAAEALERAIELGPQHFQTVLILAATDAKLGNENRSRRLAEQAHVMHPGFPLARKLVAMWRLEDGKAEEAERLVLPIVQSQPDDFGAKDLLASSLIAQGRGEEAIELLQEIAENKPESTTVQLKVGRDLISAGDSELGMQALSRALEAEPQDFAVNATLVASHLNQRNVSEALEAAKEYVAKKPDDAEAHNLLAAAQLAADEQAQALESYEQALVLDPGNNQAAQAIATMALTAGDNEKALVYVQKGLSKQPDNLELLLLQAGIGGLTKDVELHRSSLQRAIDAHPNEPGPRVLIARQLLDDGELEKALAILSTESEENHSGVLSARAEVYHRLNRFADAKRDLEKLATILPNSVELYAQLARTNEALGDRFGVERALNRILELAPDDDRFVLSRAKLAIVADKPQEARAMLESKGLTPESDDLNVLTVWMDLAHAENDTASEIVYAQRLAEMQPGSRTTVLLNRAHQRIEAFDEAETVLLKWLNSHPDDMSVLVELANLYIGMDQIDKSIEQLRRIEALDQQNLYALNNLAWYLRETAPGEAKRFAERAIEVAPDQPAIVDTYAAVLSEQRDFSAALRALERAIDRGQSLPGLRLRRVEVLLLKGDLNEARAELETLLASDPPPTVREDAEKHLAELTEASD